MSDILRDIVARNRAGEQVAIPSVCSAQPDVLRASLKWAQRKDRQIVIEATSNQVNQDGGYTGQTPRCFVEQIHNLATENAIDHDRIVLGGDHLGPQAWRNMTAQDAMQKARVLVRSYVEAGFEKIHLDCTEGCAGEGAQLPDAVTATRTANLARVCEEASGGKDILYVIGTPPLALCTDNAAMIAYAGLERFKAGHQDDMSLVARPRWPLDKKAPALLGGGKKGAKA